MKTSKYSYILLAMISFVALLSTSCVEEPINQKAPVIRVNGELLFYTDYTPSFDDYVQYKLDDIHVGDTLTFEVISVDKYRDIRWKGSRKLGVDHFKELINTDTTYQVIARRVTDHAYIDMCVDNTNHLPDFVSRSFCMEILPKEE